MDSNDFQYCIDKAVEITYLAICGAGWTDVEYCADDAWECWEPKTDVRIQQRLTANVPLIVRLFNVINDEFQVSNDELGSRTSESYSGAARRPHLHCVSIR